MCEKQVNTWFKSVLALSEKIGGMEFCNLSLETHLKVNGQNILYFKLNINSIQSSTTL